MPKQQGENMTTIKPIKQTAIKIAKNNKKLISKPIQTLTTKIKSGSINLNKQIANNGLLNKINTNKKNIIKGAIGFLSLTAGITTTFKKGVFPFKISKKTNEIISHGNEIINKSKEIIKESQKEYNEVAKLLQEGLKTGFKDMKDASGNIVRRFINIDDYNKIMEEMSENKVSRRTFFDSDDLSIKCIQKNCKQLKGGSETTKEHYEYSNFSDLLFYMKNYKKLANGTEKVGEYFEFNISNDISTYISNFERYNNDSTKYSQNFEFYSGKILTYSKDGRAWANGNSRTAKFYSFQNNELEKYNKDYRQLSDGSEEIKHEYSFKNGKLLSHERMTQIPPIEDNEEFDEFLN